MFAVTVHFPLGSFQGNSNDNLSSAEWPPHPSRLFSGLVSVAEDASDIAALEWLEGLDPPTIVASPNSDTIEETRANYVVTNVIDRKGRSYQTLPARSGGGTRGWVSVAPRDPNVSYVWDTPDTTHLEPFAAMCGRLPYLGRSTSPVVAWAEIGDLRTGAEEDRLWSPDPDGDITLGVPASGYLQALEAAFQEDQRPWSVGRPQRRYRSPGAKPTDVDDAAVPFRNREWIVFRIEGRKVPYSALLALTDRFRAAVMSQAGDDAPTVLHGHVSGGETSPAERVMFLGLPFVGRDHADGHIMGFAVSIPTKIDDGDRLRIYRSLVGIDELTHSKLGKVRLTRRDVGDARTLNPDRWARPSTRWVTAYPAVLDRFVRKQDQIAPTIAGMCERAGLPQPVSIDWSRSSLIPGPDRLLARHTVRGERRDVHKFFHVRLDFDRPIAGPVVLGHMRHFGLGLMLPEDTDRSEAER